MRITSMDASIVMPMPIREMDGTNGADTKAETECEMRVSGRASINVMFGLEPDKAEMTVSEKIVYKQLREQMKLYWLLIEDSNIQFMKKQKK